MFLITRSQDGKCKCHKTGEKVTAVTGGMVLLWSYRATPHIWISLMTCRSEGWYSRARTEQSKYHHCFIQTYFYTIPLNGSYIHTEGIIREVRRGKWSLDHTSARWFVFLLLGKPLWIVEKREQSLADVYYFHSSQLYQLDNYRDD